MRDLIRQCRGQAVLDGELARYLEEEHAGRVVGYLSEDAWRRHDPSLINRRRSRDDADDDDDEEGGGRHASSSFPPSKKARRVSIVEEEEEEEDVEMDDVPGGQNPFAPSQQAGEPSDQEDYDW